MPSLTRCPSCDTFVKPASVKPASIDDSSCPFCPAATAAGRRNPIPGVMLAAAIAVAPSCTPTVTPVYGSAPEADAAPADAAPADATPADATPADDASAAELDGGLPIYGVAPETE